jgi:(p)ppGpp synthase/HD superfamily hydrolase
MSIGTLDALKHSETLANAAPRIVLPSRVDSRAEHISTWQRAAALAARAHQHQLRKDRATPYVSHPFRVAMTVRDVFECSDPVALCVALLHDTIEDTTVDYDDLLEQFGEEVAASVAALTKNKALREDIREAEYDRRLSQADWRARLVKLADTFDNLSDLGAEERKDPARVGRLLARCERALSLSESDLPHHPETRRGAAAVRSLMERTTNPGRSV